MKIFGQLEKAQAENTTSDTASLPKGMITYRTDLNQMKVSNGTSMITIADLTTAQTMTNKTLTSPVLTDPQVTSGGVIFTQIATPSTPSSGLNKLYFKSDGNLYALNSSGIESQIGSGGSGTGKNYLGTVNNVNGNGNFELGSTTGWSLFNTTLTSLIPTGSITAGAASFTTFAATTSGKLAGAYSLSVAGTGAFTAGQGFISQAFTIDTEDQAKVMSFSAYYSVVSGATNLNFSGTSANTFAVYLYDVTNSAWIQPAGVYGMTQNSGVGKVQGTFQTTLTGTQYRLAVICINASAGASSLLFDDFTVGPQVILQGTPITDWQTFTPTGSWNTNVTYNGVWRRVGGEIEIHARVLCSGAPNAANLSFNIPFGLSIDTTKFATASVNNVEPVGIAMAVDNGTQFYPGDVVWNGGNVVFVQPYKTDATYATNATSYNITTPITFGLNDEVTVSFKVPIVGWSSQVQMSNDTDTRVVSWAAAPSGNLAIAPNNSAVKVTFNDVTSASPPLGDTHGNYTTANSRYTVSVSGDYYVQSSIYMQAGNVLNNDYILRLYRNGSLMYSGPLVRPVANTAFGLSVGGVVRNVKAGDYFEIFLYGAGNNSVSQLTVDGGYASSIFTGYRLSGPSVIAASESVNMASTNTASQSIPNATTTIVAFNSRFYDSHNALNTSTGVYTAPLSGKYRVSASVQFGSFAMAAATQEVLFYLYKNGSLYMVLDTRGGTTTSVDWLVNGSASISLLAGDTIDIRVQQQSGSSRNLSGGSVQTSFCVDRVGN